MKWKITAFTLHSTLSKTNISSKFMFMIGAFYGWFMWISYFFKNMNIYPSHILNKYFYMHIFWKQNFLDSTHRIHLYSNYKIIQTLNTCCIFPVPNPWNQIFIIVYRTVCFIWQKTLVIMLGQRCILFSWPCVSCCHFILIERYSSLLLKEQKNNFLFNCRRNCTT